MKTQYALICPSNYVEESVNLCLCWFARAPLPRVMPASGLRHRAQQLETGGAQPITQGMADPGRDASDDGSPASRVRTSEVAVPPTDLQHPASARQLGTDGGEPAAGTTAEAARTGAHGEAAEGQSPVRAAEGAPPMELQPAASPTPEGTQHASEASQPHAPPDRDAIAAATDPDARAQHAESAPRTRSPPLPQPASPAAASATATLPETTSASVAAVQGAMAAGSAPELEVLMLRAEVREKDEQLQACRARIAEKEEALWVQRQQLEVRCELGPMPMRAHETRAGPEPFPVQSAQSLAILWRIATGLREVDCWFVRDGCSRCSVFEPCVNQEAVSYMQDALEHINRLQCAATVQPVVQPSATPEPRGSVERHAPPPVPIHGMQTVTRGWLGSLAAAAGSVLSPQRLLPQLSSALPRTPPAVPGTAPPGQLPRSRTLDGDGMLDTALVGIRCALCSHVRLDCLLVCGGHAHPGLHIK